MEELLKQAFDLYNKGWATVTVGDKDNFNTMTISWGGLGTLWGKDVATIYVKPCRYTHEYLESNDYFVVSFFDGDCRNELVYIGSHSGKDENKVLNSGLKYKEVEGYMLPEKAKLSILCKKIYQNDLDITRMPKDVIDKFYLEEAPHTMYVGEVVKIIK